MEFWKVVFSLWLLLSVPGGQFVWSFLLLAVTGKTRISGCFDWVSGLTPVGVTQTITCTTDNPDAQIIWGTGFVDTIVATCAASESCQVLQHKDDSFSVSATRPSSTESRLLVTYSRLGDPRRVEVWCNDGSPVTTGCTVSLASCQAEVTWTSSGSQLIGRCQIIDDHHRFGNEGKCKWYRNNGSSPEMKADIVKSGRIHECVAKLPPPSSLGLYTYMVSITFPPLNHTPFPPFRSSLRGGAATVCSLTEPPHDPHCARVAVTNESFIFVENPPFEDTTNENQPEDEDGISPFFTGLLTGIAIGITVILLPGIAALVWLWRRSWTLSCSEGQKTRNDLHRLSSRASTSSQGDYTEPDTMSHGHSGGEETQNAQHRSSVRASTSSQGDYTEPVTRTHGYLSEQDTRNTHLPLPDRASTSSQGDYTEPVTRSHDYLTIIPEPYESLIRADINQASFYHSLHGADTTH
ncbi:uncharacterized protein LOC143286358 [Babylonia areolata]|uniref:uncharacterized protein LOC143286358 n=1 Tax=Babylonia areolata TaxID=304850 RepID=UPI003FD21224